MTLSSDITQIHADGLTFHDIVNGPAGTTVTTDNGACPTVAEAVARIGLGNYRGAWAGPGTAYSINDTVTQSSVVYRCITGHTSGASFAGDASKWTVQNAEPANVTNAQMADMAQATIKGRASGAGTGKPIDLTPAQARAAAGISAAMDSVVTASSLASARAAMGPWGDSVSTATGGTTPRSREERDGEIINVLDHGAVGDGSTDDSAAFQSAIDEASTGSVRKKIRIPAKASGYRIDTGLTVSFPLLIEGDGIESTVLTCDNDISMFTVDTSGSGTVFRGIQIIGPRYYSASSTKAGIQYVNANTSHIQNCYIRSFNDGVNYNPDINSCYSCSIVHSKITGNARIGIYAQAYTHNLVLFNCEIGGGGLIGFACDDSASPKVIGCDFEGLSASAIRIDNPSVADTFGGLITGCHFEGNDTSNGDIHIGGTGIVFGITISGNQFYQRDASPASINAVNVDGLYIAGNGVYKYNPSDPFFIKTSALNAVLIGNNNTGDDHSASFYGGTVGSISTVTFSGSMTPDTTIGDDHIVTITNNGACAMNAPAYPRTGQTIVITVRNASGGAMGTLTWDSVYKMASWSAPANGYSRSITFRYNGTNWVETSRTNSDIPN